MGHSDIDYINGIKENNEEILHALYLQYFRMVRHFVITNNGNEYDAKDIYHETLLVLIEIIKKEHFVLTSSLSTLIFAICKRIWLKHLNKNKNISYSEDFSHQNIDISENEVEQIMDEREMKEKNIYKIKIAVQSLGNPCYQLLKEFYYNKLSMEQIAQKLGYNNADVAKNQKYKCLQRLKKNFFETNITSKQIIKFTDYES